MEWMIIVLHFNVNLGISSAKHQSPSHHNNNNNNPIKERPNTLVGVQSRLANLYSVVIFCHFFDKKKPSLFH